MRPNHATASIGIALVAALSASPLASAANVSGTPHTFTVHVKDFKYVPTPLRIRVGDRVRFINDDDEAHTVTATDKSFDSEGLDTNGTWDRVFTRSGTFAYFCEMHPYMKGSVTVSK